MAQYGVMKRPYSSRDGKGLIYHELHAFTDSGRPIKGQQVTIGVAQARLALVMAMPHSTQEERRAKNLAYRDLVAEQLPVTWSGSVLDSKATENLGAGEVAEAAGDYLTNVLGRRFPILFPAIEITPDEAVE